MTEILSRAIREAVVIMVVVVVIALTVNFTRDGRIPLIANAETFRVETDAEFMVAEDARVYFDEGTAMFVDARERQLFELEHIEGAINAPSASAGLDTLAYLVPADPIMICYSTEAAQRQAGVVADMLLEVGFKRVYVLHGGLESWKKLNLPTVEGS